MPFTLKYINYADTDNIKLDKVNYNFDQLVANGGGPAGPQGAIGQSGPQGTTGPRGFQGPLGDRGFQGIQGPVYNNHWNLIGPIGSIVKDTLIPIHNTGEKFAPVVNVGYFETDIQYTTKKQLINGKTPYQWNIHRKNSAPSNLEFRIGYESVINTFYKFKLERKSNKDQLTMGFSSYLVATIGTYYADTTSFKGSNISLNDNFTIEKDSVYFKTETFFDSPVVIKEQLFIENAEAGINKIAISDDVDGLVKFKNIEEIKGIIPFGTIVSILPEIFFDNDYFINYQSLYVDDDVAIPIRVGSGINDYLGWYLCNGQKWGYLDDGLTFQFFQVPMLGKFNYQIEANDNPESISPESQGNVTTSNDLIHITGGSDIDMNAAVPQVPSLVYNVTSTISTSITEISGGNGTTFKIKQIPQIIYLGRNDLYWFDKGTGQQPPILLTFLLNDQNTGLSSLNPNPYDLVNVTDKAAGQSYVYSTTINAPSGYYWSTIPNSSDISGLPSYATITSISATGLYNNYPDILSIDINISAHPSTELIENLSINTTGFISDANLNLNLNRNQNFPNVTYGIGLSVPINYNIITGYTFDITLNTESQDGYYFNTNPAIIQSISGGATFTINSINTSIDGGGKVFGIIINATITGVPQQPIDGATLLYSIPLDIVSTRPRILSISEGNYPGLTDINGVSPGESINITLENGTTQDVRIYVGVEQISDVIHDDFTAAYFNYLLPENEIGSNSDPISVYALSSYGIYYSGRSILLPSNSISTGNLYRDSTTDDSFSVNLYWSTLTSPNVRYMIDF